jgi:hypothetical protein
VQTDYPIGRSEIDSIAQSISNGPIGLAWHEPEPWAEPHRCFENAAIKAQAEGGKVIFGWTFHCRIVEMIQGPGYIFASHHAVWHDISGRLVDVTLHPDQKHKPLGPEGNIIFLVDSSAEPVRTGNQIAPLPTRCFARDADPRLVAYVSELNQKELEACRTIYGNARES